jgi:short subunit dehydrogenase-like uncharacterized protein
MIGVIAATGFTGRLIAAELKALSANFFIAGRNQTKLKKLSAELGGTEWRQVDVSEQQTFSNLDGCRIIINCAGPFLDFGEPIVKEAVARNCHYLDLTGEQAFIKLVFEKYHEAAKQKQISLIPGCAFEYALGDAAGAQICEELTDCSLVEILYHVQNMHTSSGTRRSIIRALSAPGFEFSQGKLNKVMPGARIEKSEIDGKSYTIVSFPSGEALMLPKHCSMSEVRTNASVDAPVLIVSALAKIGLPLLGAFSDAMVKTINTDAYPSEEQRQSTRFMIKVEGRAKDKRRALTLKGNDPYGLTGLIAAQVAVYLARHQTQAFGAISPSMVAGYPFIKNIVSNAGVSWL